MQYFFFFFSLALFCSSSIKAEQQEFVKKFLSSSISDELREKIQYYLIPVEHPMKEKLDEIFSKSRPLADQAAMVEAGFVSIKFQPFSKILVANHPQLPGYIIKAYLDKIKIPKGRTEYDNFINRIKGARLIRKSIQAKGYQHLMKVPEKWLYPLPDANIYLSDDSYRMFILIEEDMNIFDENMNRKLWKSKYATQELLIALYVVTTQLGLADSAKPSNCPFSKDGRIAFIDTAVFHRKMKYHKLTPYLSFEMQAFWKKLIESQKKK